ncbi:hypothetical protein LshimejAT787_1900280 [Lyophyllum shimeji]|uniref:Uncharacterized protein n=1 Tax=Lyophyllum shimeji TaxID=47721 RepID=A0A9P3UUP0_LYOSH|nr:hypothetical protein LshimejAT787_1900280 [Lyophyllum shimeji]
MIASSKGERERDFGLAVIQMTGRPQVRLIQLLKTREMRGTFEPVPPSMRPYFRHPGHAVEAADTNRCRSTPSGGLLKTGPEMPPVSK